MKKKSVCIIPARAGSKGIPGKNIKLLNNKPLIEYSFEVAEASKIFDKIIITSDSLEIIEIAKKIGIEVPFRRPVSIAEDDTPMIDVIDHAIKYFENTDFVPDIICILQPTSPFRNINELILGYETLINEDCDSVVSVEKIPEHYSPYTAMRIENNKLEFLMNEGNFITRRQDVEDVFIRSGCFYFLKTSTLTKKKSLYGDKCIPIIINNKNTVNLDTMDDWEMAIKISENLS